MDASWSTGTVTNDGEDLYYEHSVATTDAPAVVLTHGAGGTHAAWFQQVPALVAAGYQVVTWDSRGFGNSSNRTASISTVAAAGDLAAVLDQLSLEAVHLVGQSMGGWYVTEFALAHPERALSLALCDTVGSLYTDELRQAMADFQGRGGLSVGPAVVGRHPAVTTDDLTRAFLYQQLGTFHSPPLDQVGRALGATHDHADVAALGIPVLVLAGAHDPIFPASLLRDMAAMIAGARWVEIAGAGHSPYFEQPEAFNRELLAFLAGTGVSSRPER